MYTLIMLISHVISDFIIQTDDIVKNKADIKIKGFLKHGFCLLITSIPIIVVTKLDKVLIVIGNILIIVVVHLLIDYVKEIIQNKMKDNQKSKICNLNIFLIDQIIHIAIIIIVTKSVDIEFNFMKDFLLNYLKLGEILEYNNLKMLFIITYISFSGIYVVPLLFDMVYKNIDNYSNKLNKMLKKEIEGPVDLFIDQVNTGRWIGFFERVLIIILLFSNQLPSIGFIIAAKSLARFKMMENKIFAEYYLLGTFFSITYTFITYYILYLIL